MKGKRGNEGRDAKKRRNAPAPGTQLDVGITFDNPRQGMSPERRLQESLWKQGNQEILEAGGTLEESAPAASAPLPSRTGVGTPDNTVEAAGAELGGDTGDVGTPRTEIGDSIGGTHGTSGTPEASVVVQPGEGKGTSKIKRRAA